MKIGSIEHRDPFCDHFIDTYPDFDPATLPWPELTETQLQRLRLWSCGSNDKPRQPA